MAKQVGGGGQDYMHLYGARHDYSGLSKGGSQMRSWQLDMLSAEVSPFEISASKRVKVPHRYDGLSDLID